MLSYEACKDIALKRAMDRGVVINKAYTLKGAFVFDDSTQEYAGVLPFVVDSLNGVCQGLWHYLNAKDLSMDDMVEREF